MNTKTKTARVLGAIALAMGAGALGLWMGGARADGIPSTPAMYYSGRIVEDGVPLASATLRIAVRFWSHPTLDESAYLECTSIDTAVTVRDGYFRTALSADCEDAVRENPELFSELQIADDPELPRVRMGASPYAVVAGNGVPVGTVIDWYRPTPTTPVPDGYAICDGSVIADARSPLDGQPTPDFRGRFARGITGAETVGTTAGSDVATTSDDGAHDHEFFRQTADGSCWAQYDGAGRMVSRRCSGGSEYPNHPSGLAALWVPPSTTLSLRTDTTGDHHHTVTAVPAYVGVLKLMRVR